MLFSGREIQYGSMVRLLATAAPSVSALRLTQHVQSQEVQLVIIRIVTPSVATVLIAVMSGK